MYNNHRLYYDYYQVYIYKLYEKYKGIIFNACRSCKRIQSQLKIDNNFCPEFRFKISYEEIEIFNFSSIF